MENNKEVIILNAHVNKYVIGGAVTLVLVIFLGLHAYNFKLLNSLREENTLLKLQTQNLAIFTEDKGRIVRMEELLFDRKLAKESMGANLPFFAQKVLGLCNRYKDDGLTVPILLGLIETESGFNSKAISRAADGETPVAYGLMQVVRSSATPILEKMGSPFSVDIMLQPEINLEVGTTLLIYLHRQYRAMGLEKKDEWTLSFLAYNRGEKAVMEAYNPKKSGSIRLDYVAKVKMASRFWTNNGF